MILQHIHMIVIIARGFDLNKSCHALQLGQFQQKSPLRSTTADSL